MTPAAFVVLELYPLTPNGKVDRKALPTPDGAQAELTVDYVAPRTEEEQAICGVWEDILKLDKAGIHDNFFRLGGHSLLATQVIARLRAIFNIELPLQSIFETPTIATLAEYINTILWAAKGKGAISEAAQSEREDIEI
jgi:acyl carrier protein